MLTMYGISGFSSKPVITRVSPALPSRWITPYSVRTTRR